MTLLSNNWSPWHMNVLDGLAKPGQPADTQKVIANAKRIKQEAEFRQKAEIEALRDQVSEEARAKGHAEGFALGKGEGFDQGYAEGLSAAQVEMEEAIRLALEPIRHLATGFSEALNAVDADMARHLGELALKIAQRLALDSIKANPEMICDLVSKLLNAEPELIGKPRLRLNPEDVALIETRFGSEMESLGWKIIADEKISRGGCKVISQQTEIDATLESRWDAITTAYEFSG